PSATNAPIPTNASTMVVYRVRCSRKGSGTGQAVRVILVRRHGVPVAEERTCIDARREKPPDARKHGGREEPPERTQTSAGGFPQAFHRGRGRYASRAAVVNAKPR